MNVFVRRKLAILRTRCWQLYIIKKWNKRMLHFRLIVRSLKESNVVENQAIMRPAKAKRGRIHSEIVFLIYGFTFAINARERSKPFISVFVFLSKRIFTNHAIYCLIKVIFFLEKFSNIKVPPLEKR